MSKIHMAVWLLLLEDGRSEDSFFNDVHLSFSCRFLVAQSKGDSVELTELYRVTASQPLTVSRCGVWRTGHPIPRKGSLYDRRNSLQGLVVRAVTMEVRWSVLFILPVWAFELDCYKTKKRYQVSALLKFTCFR
jgi:hypothetical protein